MRGDGVGGAAEVPGDGGFGLVAMHRRVGGVGGTVEIESERRAGTALSVSVPAAGGGDG